MPGPANTAFSPDPNLVAQITGSGQPNPGYTGPATIGAGNAPVYAAAIALAAFIVASRYIVINGVSATSATVSLTTTYVAPAGARLIVVINASGGTITATFSTGFRPSATAAPTVGASMTVEFVSNGTVWLESSRSAIVA